MNSNIAILLVIQIKKAQYCKVSLFMCVNIHEKYKFIKADFKTMQNFIATYEEIVLEYIPS